MPILQNTHPPASQKRRAVTCTLLALQRVRLSRLDVVYSDGKFTGDSKVKIKIYKINKILKLSKWCNYFDSIVKFDKQMSKYSEQKNSKIIANILGGNGIFKETFLKSYFDEYNFYNFEDTMLLGAKEYDAVLTQMYSNYMKLPKEEDRICKHSIQIRKTK